MKKYIILMLIFCCHSGVVNSGFCVDEKDNTLVIKLDRFPQLIKTDSGRSGFSTAVPGKGRRIAAGEIVPVTVRVYPMGKPLQVRKSYVPSNSDAIDDVNRYVATTTNRYVPEVLVGARNSFSTAEYIDRLFMNIHLPVSNNFSAGMEVYGGIYDLLDNGDEAAISTGLIQLALEGKYRINPEMNIYGAVVLASTHSVVSPGIEGRFEYLNRGGIEFKAGGHLWTPWAENTIGVYNNGRSSGLDAELTLPLASRLTLDMNMGVDWRFTADDTFKINTFEGTDISGGGRLRWDFFKREYRRTPVEFLGRDYLSMESMSSRVGLFASIEGSKYFKRNDNDALVPVVEESLDQRLGLSAEYVFTSHLAASAEFYIGYDPARNISFGKLYGFDTRLEYIPCARLRIYGEFAMDSEAATGITEGRTWYYGVGMNYKF